MATNFSLDFDPADVLGVAPDASLQEIRDAYRAQAKRYHPDTGGENWVFRIVSRSYEILSTARVVRATRREYDRAAPTPPPPPPGPEPSGRAWGGFGPRAGATPPPGAEARAARESFREQADRGEWVRQGAVDPEGDPTRVVDVERLTIIREIDHVWLVSETPAESHYLSCSLNVLWPDPALTVSPSSIEGAEATLTALAGVMDDLCVQSRATSSRSSVVDGRYAGWVSYPNPGRSAAAFAKLRQLLHDRGFAVKQRSRDVIIPQHWR